MKKIPSIFRKKYPTKLFQKKIISKLFIEADKKYIESLFIIEKNSKTQLDEHVVRSSFTPEKKDFQKLARIAKEIKAQKGRINLVSAALFFSILLLFIGTTVVFRNQLARLVVVSSLENIFGATAELDSVDVNLFEARIALNGLTVASRNEPMKNLFGIEAVDLDFNLLGLTRGKIIAQRLDVTGVSWSTNRTVSGELPPKKEKQWKEKQVKLAKNLEINEDKQDGLPLQTQKKASEISVDSGIRSVLERLDPTAILEKEKEALQSTKIVAEIQSTVPALTKKWETENKRIQTDVERGSHAGKTILAIQPAKINTIQEAQSAIQLVNTTSKTVQESYTTVKSSVDQATADAKLVTTLSTQAQEAINADTLRLRNLVSSITSITLDSGTQFLSSIFTTFISNTLGSYYPAFQKGIVFVQKIQKARSEEPPTMKEKARVIDRLDGRTVYFIDNSAPSLVITTTTLSTAASAQPVIGSATATGITNDQYKTQKSTGFTVDMLFEKTQFEADGFVDFRTTEEFLLYSTAKASGYPTTIPSASPGIPTISGNLFASGTVSVLQDGEIQTNALLTLQSMNAILDQFEPAFLYTTYKKALADMTDVDLELLAIINPQGEISVAVSSSADSAIRGAIQNQINSQVASVKASVKTKSDAFIAEQKNSYTSEISRFTKTVNDTKKSYDTLKDYEKVGETKKAELENRIKEITASAAAPAQKAATQAAEAASSNLPSGVKKLF